MNVVTPRAAPWWLVVVVGVLPVVGHAQAPAAKVKRPKVIVLDFPPEKSFDANANQAFNEFYANDLRDQGLQVVTSADMVAALGVEKQKQMMGCSDSSCLAELGGALGADYLARGNFAFLGSLTALTLSLQDARGQELNRVALKVQGHDPGVLLEKMESLVPQLVQPLRDSGRLPSASTPTSEVAASPSPTPNLSAPVSSASDSGTSTLTYALLGGGTVGVVGGGVVLGLGASSFSSWRGSYFHLAGSTPQSASQLASAHQTANQELGVGGALLGVGLAVAAGGVWEFLNASSAPNASTSATAK